MVGIVSEKKKFLGKGFYNPKSKITLRVVTRRQEPVDDAFWERRLLEAFTRRLSNQQAARLVFSESDLLPGLIIDRYRDLLVLQTLSLGMDRLKDLVVAVLEKQYRPTAIIERNDPAVRELEGMTRQKGILRGGFAGTVEVEIGGKILTVDPLEGQKTGLYLDQQENWTACRRYSRGRILDLFSYQGGFAVSLADLASEAIAVDSSAEALRIARLNLERNGLTNIALTESNGFDYLREADRTGERFDMILLDPPPFASGKDKLAGGTRGYKEINLRALKILNPGGVLVTCCCSQNFTEPLFYDMLFEAGRDARREIQVLEKRGAASDHPVLLTFPESFYLQCWILRVI